MVVDELQSRLKDKGLLQLQACIGGHWVSSKATKSYKARTSACKQRHGLGFAPVEANSIL